MKGKAIIMAVCLLAYLAGWIAVPRMMRAVVPVSADCCSKMDKKASPHKCPGDEKEERRCADCCLSCPLCYTMILTVPSQEERLSTPVTTSYGNLPIIYSGEYCTDVWRPPNAA